MITGLTGETVSVNELPLEDTYADILNKARKGWRLTVDDLAERAGLPTDTVQVLLSGQADWTSPGLLDALETLAFVLNLHGPSLRQLAQNQWCPAPSPPLDGLAMFTTWYGDMTVNAYLAWDPATGQAVSFDTGSRCQPMLDHLKSRALTLRKIFITHTHMDHLADLDALQQASDADSYGSAAENPLGLKPLSHGDGLVVGALKIRVLGTSGHTPGGLSYFIDGLTRPLVIVGDALFAGSMGGAPYAYQEALHHNRTRILALPEHTLIGPGHGPLTTVGEEQAHNPFFPECK
jgi:glyoxylase-like metal-dependent hydrolase (beta-lactamase superfamily II)